MVNSLAVMADGVWYNLGMDGWTNVGDPHNDLCEHNFIKTFSSC